MPYPTSLDSLDRPESANSLGANHHSLMHTAEQVAIEALEAKVGITGSTVGTSIEKRLTDVIAAVAALTGTQIAFNASGLQITGTNVQQALASVDGLLGVTVQRAGTTIARRNTVNFRSSDGTITPTITDAGGIVTVDLSTKASAVTPLTPSFTITPTSGNVPFTASADGSASTGSSPVRTWAWNWGDGASTAASTSPTATHQYTVAGTYTVTLTVVDAANNTASTTKTVTASTAGGAGVDLSVTSLTWSPTSPQVGDAVTFTVTIKNNGTTAVPAGQGAGQNIGIGLYLDGATTAFTYTNVSAGLAGGASITQAMTAGWAPGPTWVATAGSHTVDAWVNDANTITETNTANNHLSQTVTVVTPVPAADATDRGTTTAITAGTTLASNSFTPTANSLLVVVVEGTTI